MAEEPAMDTLNGLVCSLDFIIRCAVYCIDFDIGMRFSESAAAVVVVVAAVVVVVVLLIDGSNVIKAHRNISRAAFSSP